MSIIINFLLVVDVIVSLLIILVVLMQRPKNEGLGAAFGGDVTSQFLGVQTTNVLQKATRLLGAAFFLVTLILSILYAKQGASQSAIQQQLTSMPVPVAATTPGDKEVTPLVPPKAEPGSAFTPAPLSVDTTLSGSTAAPAGSPGLSLKPDVSTGNSMAIPGDSEKASTTPEPLATPEAAASAKPSPTAQR
jgi:preprotein translocase subunit SecG